MSRISHVLSKRSRAALRSEQAEAANSRWSTTSQDEFVQLDEVGLSVSSIRYVFTGLTSFLVLVVVIVLVTVSNAGWEIEETYNNSGVFSVYQTRAPAGLLTTMLAVGAGCIALTAAISFIVIGHVLGVSGGRGRRESYTHDVTTGFKEGDTPARPRAAANLQDLKGLAPMVPVVAVHRQATPQRLRAAVLPIELTEPPPEERLPTILLPRRVATDPSKAREGGGRARGRRGDPTGSRSDKSGGSGKSVGSVKSIGSIGSGGSGGSGEDGDSDRLGSRATTLATRRQSKGAAAPADEDIAAPLTAPAATFVAAPADAPAAAAPPAEGAVDPLLNRLGRHASESALPTRASLRVSTASVTSVPTHRTSRHASTPTAAEAAGQPQRTSRQLSGLPRASACSLASRASGGRSRAATAAATAGGVDAGTDAGVRPSHGESAAEQARRISEADLRAVRAAEADATAAALGAVEADDDAMVKLCPATPEATASSTRPDCRSPSPRLPLALALALTSA